MKKVKKAIKQPTNLELLSAIQGNTVAIEVNRAVIKENTIAIEEIRTVVRENTTSIEESKAAICENTVAIEEIRTVVRENTASIDENRQAIGQSYQVGQENTLHISELRSMMKESRGMLDDLIETIQAFAYQTDQRFDQLDNRVMNVESQVMHVENRVINIERTMPQLVTKSYLDDKLAEMRGDFVSTTRQEDQKVTSLVDILRQRKLITSADVKRLMVMTPFPKSK